MPPSTDAPERFAADVLDRLVTRLTAPRDTGTEPEKYTYRISHAWTRGPMLYVVYRAEPLDITWGLARDTGESLIDSGPWTDPAEAALYYQLLDFDEGWPGPLSPEPGRDPEIIRWRGDRLDGLPQHRSDLTVTPRDSGSDAAGNDRDRRHHRIREHYGLTDADPLLGQLIDLDDRTGTVTRGLDRNGPGGEHGHGLDR